MLKISFPPFLYNSPPKILVLPFSVLTNPNPKIIVCEAKRKLATQHAQSQEDPTRKQPSKYLISMAAILVVSDYKSEDETPLIGRRSTAAIPYWASDTIDHTGMDGGLRRAMNMNPTDSESAIVTGEYMAETHSAPPVALAPSPVAFDAYDWVQADVLLYESEFTSRDSVERFNALLSRSGKEKYAVAAPCHRGEIVCYRPPPNNNDRFTFVYETMLTKIRVCFPLSNFECDVLQYLNIAPTQLHPNGWGFLRAFSILMKGLDSVPSIGWFFYYFQAKANTKVGWTSLNKQPRRGILLALTQSYKDFKPKFFRVRAGSRCPHLLVDQEGKEKFPLYWTKGPLAKLKYDSRWLTEDEKKDIAKLEGAKTMKCSNLLGLEDDEEALFVYLCKYSHLIHLVLFDCE